MGGDVRLWPAPVITTPQVAPCHPSWVFTVVLCPPPCSLWRFLPGTHVWSSPFLVRNSDHLAKP